LILSAALSSKSKSWSSLAIGLAVASRRDVPQRPPRRLGPTVAQRGPISRKALSVWNGFLFPLVLKQSSSDRVLPLALWSFQDEMTINVPVVMAAVVLTSVPMMTLYVLGRRYLVAGLTAGVGK
jgi:hypothetical protein